ncbi:MAG: hypothetical protein UT08_C0004G0042 [Candidatus Woesebacteria bacterium GW2011_GWB1_38_8]|uniref:Uncharacterized protein n=2 Tax=Candidatus Woeseibacteriota TaxID=1752722 RepID=A0A0G0LCW7_9BACT|nr:MAG: hypothetical protein UT08_C0004G0042 [Candidatus Woesebacteria bacterium GW2011_GWB1_38_8]OGM20616.1 MAG: hypothetical protein A2863_01725 [Candidatus Woesebacteria bacterium RIFCSPHIGHO2_01_FULL_38_9b]
MLEFLITLLLLVLSAQPIIPGDVKSNISQNLIEHLANVQNIPSENANPLDIITEILSPTPTQFEEFETETLVPSGNSNSSSSLSGSNNNNTSDKSEAYNTNSEKPIGEVANTAIQNSPALVPCSENPDLCDPKPTIIIYPTLTPFPTPKIEPEPTICPDKEIVCPMYACLEVREPVYQGCGCGCNPMIL